MAKRTLETAVSALFPRFVSPRAAGPFAKTLEDSGVVDYLCTWDALTSWWPQSLWTEADAPTADLIKDCDSLPDPYVAGAFAMAATESLGFSLSTDVRRAPAETMQSLLTMGASNGGRVKMLLGAGEVRQFKPFGYRRAEGLDRVEELLQIYRLLLESEGPFDFEGKHYNFKQGWIGAGGREHHPKIFAMGGGPRLIDLAARYADGFCSAIPDVFPTPEKLEAKVREIKEKVESYGRDPDAFEVAIMAQSLIHEDPDVIQQAVDNPLVRWTAAIGGRVNQADWLEEGLEPVFPIDWHYAIKLLPAEFDRDAAEAITNKVPEEMVRKSYTPIGGVKEVAAQCQEYVDAGCTFMIMADMLPLVLPFSEAEAGTQRSIDVCRILKENAK